MSIQGSINQSLSNVEQSTYYTTTINKPELSQEEKSELNQAKVEQAKAKTEQERQIAQAKVEQIQAKAEQERQISQAKIENYQARTNMLQVKQEQAMRKMEEQMQAKQTQRRQFKYYVYDMDTPFGKFKELSPDLQKKILANYSASDRQRIMREKEGEWKFNARKKEQSKQR